MQNYEKAGHPVLGVILGILGIFVALTLSFLTGALGGGIALLLGLIALLLGIAGTRKGGKGAGAIITGALAMVLACVFTFTSISTVNTMRENAEKSGVAPLLAEYADNPYLGMLGIALKMPKDEGSLAELQNQIDQLNQLNTEAAK